MQESQTNDQPVAGSDGGNGSENLLHDGSSVTGDEVLDSVTDTYQLVEYAQGDLYLLITETPSGWDGFLAVNTFPAISVNDQPGLLECLDLLICKMCELIEDAKLVERHLEGLFAVQFQKERGK